MPFYEVEHIIPLSHLQKDNLAQSITRVHSRLFSTPSLFVNVRFTDISNHDTYVGGKRRSFNRILAHVRPGGGRSTETFNNLCDELMKAWNLVINDGQLGKGERELRAIFVLGTIVAGAEAGFALPPAGEDKNWLKENVDGFRKKADGGDEDFEDLLMELREREDLQ